MTDRDTKFKEFSELLWSDIRTAFDERDIYIDGNMPQPDIDAIVEPIIAQRAYDLVVHAVSEYDRVNPDYAKKSMDQIPDLTEWPTLPTSSPQDHAPD